MWADSSFLIAAICHCCCCPAPSYNFQVRDREEAARISNAYAPEHLIVNVQDAEAWLPLLDNAGSVFLGRCVCLACWASGTCTRQRLRVGRQGQTGSMLSTGAPPNIPRCRWCRCCLCPLPAHTLLHRWTPESVGDYASGTNHVLPTYGYARMYSGVSLDSFTKKMTVQSLSYEGLQVLGPHVAKMAEVEGLDAHRRAVTLRLESSS